MLPPIRSIITRNARDPYANVSEGSVGSSGEAIVVSIVTGEASSTNRVSAETISSMQVTLFLADS